MYLIALAQGDKTPKLATVVSESMPHLKRGAMRDFLNILKEHNYYKDGYWNRTDSIYTFETGSQIEFFGADTPDKVRGPRRDRLFINEANNIPYMVYDQLEVRTRELVLLDWNPTNEFWYYTDLYPHRKEDIDFITLTYKDNEALEKNVIESIESRQHNKNWWKVYGLGQLGEAEGRIYKDWKIIDDIPHEARLIRRGLDFGYSNDPAALVDIYYFNGGYVLEEKLYQKGMANKTIADFIKNLKEPGTLVKADSAEPKSIDEIKGYGINVIAVTKGKDSVNQGISYVQDQRISVTSKSKNIETTSGKLIRMAIPLMCQVIG
ncbi:MAG: terminase large subunit [Nitrospiria bacterium]